MPTEEPSRAGLTKTGSPSASSSATTRGGIVAEALERHRSVLHLGNAGLGHHRLEQQLVHAQRRSQHPGADIGDIEALEQPLDGPVLAKGPVQDREDDVHPGDAAARLERQRIALQAPHAVASDLDLDRLVAGRFEAAAHRSRRSERDLVLGGAAATEHRYPQARVGHGTSGGGLGLLVVCVGFL